MAVKRLSNCFGRNVFYWKALGLWPGQTPSKCYKIFSVLYLFLALFAYNFLLTLNLIYTPRNIELFIRELLFYFIKVTIAAKISMTLLKRKEILEAFELLDSEFFKGDDEVSKKYIEDSTKIYLTCFKLFQVLLHLLFVYVICMPFVLFLAFGADKVLPIAKYYFLSDGIRNDYYGYLYAYQTFCLYTIMSYNLSCDTFMSGLIWIAITQLKVINHKLHNLKLGELEQKKDKNIQDQIMHNKLVQCLKHYNLYLEYFSKIQVIIDFAMFVTFGLSGCIIGVALCGLALLPLSRSYIIFMVFYLVTVVSEIFVPAWLGTKLYYSNHELAFAAYNSDWISRSEKFKRSLRLFVERTNKPMILRAGKIFPLSFTTFFATIKLAYSSFTLVRRLQDQQNQM